MRTKPSIDYEQTPTNNINNNEVASNLASSSTDTKRMSKYGGF